MASAFQGFARSLNLSESSTDRDILNNLGEEPIADDIVLFVNNARNVSILDVIAGLPPEGNINGDTITFNSNLQKFVFTNGTKITVNDITYYVGDSNNINSFKLYSNQSLTTLVLIPPAGIYKRSDLVTKDDILRISPIRDKVVQNIGLSQIVAGDNDSTLAADNLYNSIISLMNSVGSRFPNTLGEYFDDIEKNIGIFEFKKKKSISSVQDFASTSAISLNGNILVRDIDGTNNTTILPTGPGIFILNTADNTSQRIFSNNENVWSFQPPAPLIPTYLAVNSSEIAIGNLVFEEGAIFLRKGGLPIITSETALSETYTHYMSVTVNDEEYNILLK